MGIFTWIESFIPKMKWYDISLIKLAVLFSTLLLVSVWHGFRNFVLEIDWYWYVILLVAVMTPLLKKLFTK